MPGEVIFEVSDDGKSFREAGRMRPEAAMQDYTVQTWDCVLPVSLQARYIRVKALNPGEIPAWHPGAGYESFIFIDEIWAE